MDQLGSDMLLDSDYDEKRLTPSDENVALISPDEGDSMTEASTEPAAPWPPTTKP